MGLNVFYSIAPRFLNASICIVLGERQLFNHLIMIEKENKRREDDFSKTGKLKK